MAPKPVKDFFQKYGEDVDLSNIDWLMSLPAIDKNPLLKNSAKDPEKKALLDKYIENRNDATKRLELLQKVFNKTERIQEANNQDAVQWLAIEQISAQDKCGSLQAARLYAKEARDRSHSREAFKREGIRQYEYTDKKVITSRIRRETVGTYGESDLQAADYSEITASLRSSDAPPEKS